MSAQQQTSPLQMRILGAGAGAFGLWLILIGFGMVPPPGGPRNLHGPLWISIAAGLPFFLAGLAMLLQAWGGANDSGEFPIATPVWMCAAQVLLNVAIFACFATLGSWVAFGSGSRAFSGSLMFFSHGADEIIGRSLFGFGAVLCWAGTLLFAVVGFRKLRARGRAKSAGAPQ